MTRSEIHFERKGGDVSLRLGKHGEEILTLLVKGAVVLTFEDPQAAVALGEDLAREGRAAMKHRAETEGVK